MTDLPPDLHAPYQGYVYSYPHKTAYGPLTPPRPLAELWRPEPRDRRFLYLHVPFCEMRCGFCNLFTLANPNGDLETAYLTALTRDVGAVAEATGAARPAQVALGGGTPTFLTPQALAQVFALLNEGFGIEGLPVAVETSPKTATADRLSVLRDWGVSRLSIGVQSFLEPETRAMGRPQRLPELEAALDRIRHAGFAQLNIDLIYGAEGQTPESFGHSITRALNWQPEEIYLYPLYVRPKTGLDGRREVWDAHRLELYRTGRDRLLSEGYTQISMRHFRRRGAADLLSEHSCQEDGMIGLGPGARSYTQSVHYTSIPFAVSRAAVLSTLKDYIALGHDAFATARHGAVLDAAERARRFLLKSLLRSEGVDCARFHTLHRADLLVVFPELKVLLDCGLLEQIQGRIRPTPAGLERSDAIGPWLYAPAVSDRMRSFEAI